MSKRLSQIEAEKRLNDRGISFKPFVYSGRLNEIEIQCSNCFEWRTMVYKEVFENKTTMCKKCAIVQTKILTQEEAEQKLINMGVIYKPFIYKSQTTQIEIQCPQCLEWREVGYDSFIKNRKSILCISCFNNNKKLFQEDIEKRLNKMGVNFKPFIYTTSKETRIEIQCVKCKEWREVGYETFIIEKTILCRKCSNTNKGFLTQEEAEQKLHNRKIIFKPFTYTTYNETKIEIQCPRCFKWRKVGYNSIQETPLECRKCSKTLTQKEAEKKLNNIYIIFKPFIYVSNTTKIEYKCSKCNKWKSATYASIIKGVKLCQECRNHIGGLNAKRIDQSIAEKFLTELKIEFKPFLFTTTAKTIIEYKCKNCKKWSKTKYHNFQKGMASKCTKCHKTFKLTQEEVERRLSKNNIEYKPFIYENSDTKIEFKCINCYEWNEKKYYKIIQGQTICYDCSKHTSQGEIELRNFIKINNNIKPNYKCGGNEIDVYLPLLKIGFEFNGDYYHANPNKYEKNYFNKVCKQTAQEIWDKDRKKIEYFDSIKIKVYTIWEDDWKNHRKETEKRILEIINFHKNDNQGTN